MTCHSQAYQALSRARGPPVDPFEQTQTSDPLGLYRRERVSVELKFRSRQGQLAMTARQIELEVPVPTLSVTPNRRRNDLG